MSGIAGWIDFVRDIDRQHGVVRSMVATLANRGPDGERVWGSGHAVLGHRRLAVPGSVLGAQPVVAEVEGRVLAALAFDGEVYNASALCSRLHSAGHRISGDDHAHVLLHAYLEWGAAFPEQVEGTFAIAVWDARTEELLLARDHLGVKPLYYTSLPTGVVFGSEPKAVLAHPLVEAVADTDTLREAMAFTATPGNGLFAGMRKIRAGSTTRVTAGGTKDQTFWELTAAPHTDDERTTVATVRGLMEEAVERQLLAHGETSVLLSGGIDSSSVAAIAAGLLKRRGGQLRTHTVGFTTGESGGGGPKGRSEDPAYAAEVARWLGAEHTEINLAPADLTDPVAWRRMVVDQQDMPTPVCTYPATLRRLCAAVATETNTALTGQRQTLFSSFMVSDPGVYDAQQLPWVAYGQLRSGGSMLGTGLFDKGLMARLDIAGYCAQDYRDSVARTPQLSGLRPRDRRMRELTYLFYRGWWELCVALDETAATSSGLETRWPFADPALLQYGLNIPYDMKIPNGRDKGMLRAAVADLLPDHIVNRPASSFPVTWDPAYLGFLDTCLAEVLTDPDAPVRPLLDEAAVAELVGGGRGAANPWLARTNIEMVLQVDSWLRTYQVRLAL